MKHPHILIRTALCAMAACAVMAGASEPLITGTLPNMNVVPPLLTIVGQNFPSSLSAVTLDGMALTVVSNAATEIVVQLPLAVYGSYTLAVEFGSITRRFIATFGAVGLNTIYSVQVGPGGTPPPPITPGASVTVASFQLVEGFYTLEGKVDVEYTTGTANNTVHCQVNASGAGLINRDTEGWAYVLAGVSSPFELTLFGDISVAANGVGTFDVVCTTSNTTVNTYMVLLHMNQANVQGVSGAP